MSIDVEKEMERVVHETYKRYCLMLESEGMSEKEIAANVIYSQLSTLCGFVECITKGTESNGALLKKTIIDSLTKEFNKELN